MKVKSLVVVGLSAAVLALVGCSTTKKNMGAPVSDADAGATTAGMGSDTDFGGTGPHMSAAACRQAPSNQAYYFDLNQYDIHQQDYVCVNKQAQYLVQHTAAKVRLEGNCDNRGSREYNRALGWKRANALKSALLNQGVSPAQVNTFSWGSEKASPGAGEGVWAKDRRVDLLYKAK